MKDTLAAGVTRVERLVVDEARTIAFLGAELRLYSTPAMVSDVEYACLRLIDEHLGAGHSSVGTEIAIEHLGATPLGEMVEVRVEVAGVEGRRVSLEAEVRDALEVVGRGRHTRFVIDVARHATRVEKKRAALQTVRAGGRAEPA